MNIFATHLTTLHAVHTRFILNLPDEELQSAPRIFFQLEQAWWFYDDFICDAAAAAAAAEGGGNKAEQLRRFKHVKPFALAMFEFSPLLRPMLPKFNQMYDEFSNYKRSISTYGTILLNKDASHLVLCRVYKGKKWTLPGGKVNQNESGKDAAARETYEETGFDPESERGICADWMERRERGEVVEELADDTSDGKKLLPWDPLQDSDKLTYTEKDSNKRLTCYVCRGVPENFPFEPVARKEVSEVKWQELTSLPKQTFRVMPFLSQVKRWIKKDNRKRGIVDVSRSGSRSKQKEYSTPTRPGKQQRGKSREEDLDNDDIVLTPFFSNDGSAPWEEEKEKGKPGELTPFFSEDGNAPWEEKEQDLKEEGSPKKGEKQRDKSSGKKGRNNSRARSGSRGSYGSRAGSRGREVSASDPLVQSALASPGESNRWTEDEMFATNEHLLGRKITYDGNPHDFAEKGFEVGGDDGGSSRVDPHAFRVVGGTFMNSSSEGGGGGMLLSAPPKASALQPLTARRRRSKSGGSDVSGLSGDGDLGGAEADGDMILTPFFSDDGKSPWEDGALGGGGSKDTKKKNATVSPPSVRSGGQSNTNKQGLALLTRLRQGTPANEGGGDDTATAAINKDEKKTSKKKDKKKKIDADKNSSGKTAEEDSPNIFMTDREITAKSQKEKLSILPPPQPQAVLAKAQAEDDVHWRWMRRWVEDLPQTEPTKEFGDFRLDVDLIMNGMKTI